MVTAGSGLKLRKEASTSAEVLTVLPSGTIVDVERAGQDWVSIVTDAGQKGYVSADYLTVKTGEKPCLLYTSSAGRCKREPHHCTDLSGGFALRNGIFYMGQGNELRGTHQ